MIATGTGLETSPALLDILRYMNIMMKLLLPTFQPSHVECVSRDEPRPSMPQCAPTVTREDPANLIPKNYWKDTRR